MFVLPRSPWAKAPAPKLPATLRRRDWLLPIGAGVATLILVVFGFVVLLMDGKRNGPPSKNEEVPLAQTLDLAKNYLTKGEFWHARGQLEKLLQDKRLPGTSNERHIRHLAKEAAIYTDLLPLALEEILQIAGKGGQEWQREFDGRFRGKTLLLDSRFQRDARGIWQCDYQLFRGQEKAKLEWSDVELFGRLQLQGPHRLILGLRLDAVRLEAPGPTWVVHFEQQGAVLLTDSDAARMVCPELGREEARGVLARQENWVSTLGW